MPEPAWGNRDIIIGKGDHLAPCHRQASIPRLTEPLSALKNIAQRESRGPSKPLDYGRSSIRYPRIPANALCYFGVPAYLFRRLFASFLQWALTLNLRQRFHHKLRLYQVAGAIAESYHLAKQGK